MSKCSSTKVVLGGMLVALLATCLPAISIAGTLTESGYEAARLATYDDAKGETSFALSLSPQLDQHPQRSSDVVIFVDTSASQSGVFKKDSIAAVKQLLANLNAADRVKLIAVDLNPVELTSDFVRPDSDAAAVALEKLSDRVSLGSTDFKLMFETAVKQFGEDSDKNRNVIYVGDGVSRGDFLNSDKFSTSVKSLVDRRISVSSFAIGPERDIEMLAALANNTGGNVFVDTDEPSSIDNSAGGLARTVHGSVFWPRATVLPETISEIYPKQTPPLRTDRDTIVIGSLVDRGDLEIVIKGEINGQPMTMNWPVSAEQSNVDFAFLPKLVDAARKTGGLTLPTVGSSGLREAARVAMASSQQLSHLGATALATGNVNAAKTLASAALASDPSNMEAEVLSQAADNVDESFNPAITLESPTQDPIPTPIPDQVVPGQVQPGQDQFVEPPLVIQGSEQDEIDRLMQEAGAATEQIIATEEDLTRVRVGRLKAQVQFELERARRDMATQPGAAVERLKSTIDILDQTTDIAPGVVAELRSRVESALMTARREKLEFDDAEALADHNRAIAEERRRTVDRWRTREEKISGLINRFNSLLIDGGYDDAENVTYDALLSDPDLPEAVQANEAARVYKNHALLFELKRLRKLNFLASMYQVEKSATAFPGDPPLVFPDKLEWDRKKALRAKYQDVRLAGNANDERILRVLDENVDMEYDEAPFIEVMDELREKYKITIVLDQSARDDALSEDEPITFNVAGIRLKNALRLMLKEKNATFIVRNEVLNIISLDVASDPEWFVTNVYNVGDLVAPRNNPGGGFGGGGGGGGFGGGGGAGGFGGGGGGRGGFGQGGGGGGIFCIDDSLYSAAKKKKATAEMRSGPKVLTKSTGESWSEYFSNHHAAPADVRTTVRSLMKKNQTNEIVELLQGAIKNNQIQPWMYEAMVLAMQIEDWPRADIERALMSSVDLSSDEDDILIAADYMARNKMEKRAIQILKDIAEIDTNRPEPFVIGLRAAQNIDDLDGIKWATIGILSQAWPKHRDVIKKAILAAKATQMRLEKENRVKELAEYNRQLDEALYRDCIIKVSWTGDADLDLYVEEPGGTVCSRNNPRTVGGGVMLGDAYSSGSDQSGETAEYYVLPRGFSGDYRVLIRRVWGKVTSGKVTVAIYNHFRTDKEASQQKQVEIDDKGALVLFSLADGRRTQPLEEHAVETIAEEQFIVKRNILAQQLDDSYSSGAASDFYRSRLGSNEFNPNEFGGFGNFDPRNGLLRRSPVGYQPVISIIPQGTFMTVNHATTADRLYVLVSVSPFFSAISQVDTFNILGTANTAQGVGGGGVGGGGVGGGGAIGGGGGGVGGGLF